MARLKTSYVLLFSFILFANIISCASLPAQPSSVTIDAAKTKDAISPYIYGQFIEHLGRSIYGGIWAEMLEDRKFYHPITADYKPYVKSKAIPAEAEFQVVGASPWQIIGSANSVMMVKENAFVGEHSPLINAGSGIRQLDLGLVKGKDYTGYIYLKAKEGNPSVSVSLAWGDNQQESMQFKTLQTEYVKYPFWFTSGGDTIKGKLEIKVDGGSCFVGTVSIMPADNINGMRADTIAVLKELNATVYRWPGGNFVSGYDWRDGIGDRDKRPPRTNPAWTGVEHNDFGMHEYIDFCRIVGAEPLITVNTGYGDAYSCLAELEYANGSEYTPMGSLRKVNGSAKPFGVRLWCVGNEMWGDWQLGYMSLEDYIIKHNWIVGKMRAFDPNIVCFASGDVGTKWSEGLLKGSADYIDVIAEHFYITPNLDDVTAHVDQLLDRIKSIITYHRDLRTKLDVLKGKNIKVAITEWNYWNYNPGEGANLKPVDAYWYGELGRRYSMKDGLGIAAGLHEYYRNSDIVFLAFYAQTVNVIGCIKTTKTAAAIETTGLSLEMYRDHYGTIPVEVTNNNKALDIAAAWTPDRKALTIGVVNTTSRQQQITMDLKGVNLTGAGTVWVIANSDPMAYNEPGKEPKVAIRESKVTGVSNQLTVPGYSVNLYRLDVKN
jgi:alpha-L-arabinofuranosidase